MSRKELESKFKREDAFGIEYESKIPVTALKDEPLTYFLFRDTAKPYGQFLKENDVKSVSVCVQRIDVDYCRKQKSPYGLALSVGDIRHDWSRLEGGKTDLDQSLRVFGTLRSPLEPLANK